MDGVAPADFTIAGLFQLKASEFCLTGLPVFIEGRALETGCSTGLSEGQVKLKLDA